MVGIASASTLVARRGDGELEISAHLLRSSATVTPADLAVPLRAA
jgi:hypothetical protein